MSLIILDQRPETKQMLDEVTGLLTLTDLKTERSTFHDWLDVIAMMRYTLYRITSVCLVRTECASKAIV